MQKVTAKQLQAMQERNEDFLLVNTLDQKDFASTRIPGSINIPQSRADFVQRVEKRAGSKRKQVVVYCASKQCDSSEQAAMKLEDAGFGNVYDFTAGAEGWKQAGGELDVGTSQARGSSSQVRRS